MEVEVDYRTVYVQTSHTTKHTKQNIIKHDVKLIA